MLTGALCLGLLGMADRLYTIYLPDVNAFTRERTYARGCIGTLEIKIARELQFRLQIRSPLRSLSVIITYRESILSLI